MMNVKETYLFAAEMHAKHPDKRGGQIPYGLHLLRVAARIRERGEKCQKSAMLHDIVEDTPITVTDLARLGFDDDTTKTVGLVSRNLFPNESFDEWTRIITLSKDADAIATKIADVADNLSSERMSKLDLPPIKQKQTASMSERLFASIDGRIRLGGEGGLHRRYYGTLDSFCACDNELAKHSRQFGTLEDYLFAGTICGQDTLTLLGNETGGCFTQCTLSIITDKHGNPYLVATPDEALRRAYMATASDAHQELVDRQQERDHGEHHITILNAKEYGQVRKRFGENLVFPDNMRFSMYGIGFAESGSEKAIFSCCASGEGETLRRNFGLSPKDFHMTLGFKSKDIHNVRKNADTQFIPFGETSKKLQDTLPTPVKRSSTRPC